MVFDVTPITTDRPFDCGPASLKMLLAYYGIEASLEELREECDTRLSGCSMATLARVGRAHGLKDLMLYGETAADLLKQDRPAVIWWMYNHFVVFCGRDEKGDVVICNPARGRYPIDVGTFVAKCCGTQLGQKVALCNGKPEDLPE